MKFLQALLIGVLLVCTPGSAIAQEFYDPIEPVNRAIFTFNDKLDEWVIEPTARGYDYITPNPIKRGIGNFFENIHFPQYLVSDLLQGKLSQAGVHTGRFLINTTIGVLGFMDVAKDMGLEPHWEDIGTAFGYWGIGPGIYIVLPLLGPSDARDAIGRIGDNVLNPTFYVDNWWITGGLRAVEVVDDRRRLLDAIDSAKQTSIDFYGFMRASYYQRRLNLIYDNNPPPELLPSGEGDFGPPGDEDVIGDGVKEKALPNR